MIRTLEFADAIGARGVIAVPIFSPKFLPELSPQRLHDLSPFADEDTLITQLLIAMLEVRWSSGTRMERQQSSWSR